MVFYTNRNTFLQRLHPAAALMLMVLYGGGMLLLNNPIYIALLIGWVIILSYLDGCIKEVFGITRYLLLAALFIIVANPLLNHNGSTLILYVPSLRLYITFEALMYGVIMALRLYGITLVLGLSNMILHPDRTFGFFSKFMGKSALLMSMTLRLFPMILNSCRSIVDAERIRGSSVNEKRFLKRVKNQGAVVTILFMGCLEDAGDMAESMYSRGYGSGKRSTYFKEILSNVDIAFIILFVAEMVLFIVLQSGGYNTMSYYPQMDNPIEHLSLITIVFVAICGIPAAVNWGWKHGSIKN
jgi:energy-coupling factor transport system permease protein